MTDNTPLCHFCCQGVEYHQLNPCINQNGVTMVYVKAVNGCVFFQNWYVYTYIGASDSVRGLCS